MDTVWSHSGDYGDLLAALPAAWAKGWTDLVLYPAPCTGNRMTRERVEVIRPLLEAQPYIHSVRWAEGPQGKNGDGWRTQYINRFNLADIFSTWADVPHHPREQPWLFVRERKRVAKVVFARSGRYRNDHFPWHRVYEKYKSAAVFVGLADEHADFICNIGPVDWCPTVDYLDLAKVIAGADLFIGNQSSPFWVALGLGVPVVLEVCTWCQNCHWQRHGFEYGMNAGVRLPDDVEEFWLTTMAAKGDGFSVVSPDRRAVLARTVRDVEGVDGDLAELGVYKGGTAKIMACAGVGRRLHLFDTFEGLPADDAHPAGRHRRGEFAAEMADVRQLLTGFDVAFHPGCFPSTTTGLEDVRYCGVHIDADLYQSTTDAIAYFWPRLARGGYLVFDDWRWEACPGVEMALREHFHPAQIEETAPHQCRVRKDAS